MKKITRMSWFLLIGFMSLALFSCTQTLDEAVQSMKKELPKDCGGGMKMTNIENNADFLVLTMSTNEEDMRLDNPLIEPVLQSLSGQMKEEFFKDSDIKPLLAQCKEENKGFKVLLEGENTKKSLTLLEIPLKELQERQDL